MNTVTRLSLYGAGLVLVFGAMFFAGRALVPEETVATWTREAEESTGQHEGMSTPDESASGGHVRGLGIEQDGYRLGPVSSPSSAGQTGELSFEVIGPDGESFKNFALNHEKRLHLIVVRSDGAGFEHVHPKMNPETGTWSTPWQWSRGGTFRLIADFVPEGGEKQPDVTLSRSVEVAGDYAPAGKPLSRTDSVDGFDLSIDGDLVAGESRSLAISISRDGAPETHLQPYLGAFGHLVALREGDLAYLHVHSEDDHADPGGEEEPHAHEEASAGREIDFVSEAPTPGRYLLYLDFKVDGQVHTAEFVLEAR